MQKGTVVGKRAVVLGSTGGVGRLIVRVLAQDPRVVHVTAIVRSTKPMNFWFATEDVVAEKKLKQVEVKNFDNLKDFEKEFAGHDALFSALGLYTQDVKDEAEFDKVEVGYNEVASHMAIKGGAKSSAFLSGMGVTKPQDVGFFTPMFGRVKGRAEAMFERLFPSGLSARAGGIMDRPGEQRFVDRLNSFLSFMTSTPYAIYAIDIAKGMVQGGLIDPVSPHQVKSNDDLKDLSKAYDLGLAAASKPEAKE